MSDWPRVAVVGGSIGGLTTGLLLSELGCDVRVFERSPNPLEDRGAGIVVLRATERYFRERYGGLSDRVAFTLPRWKWVDGTGTVIVDDPSDFRYGSWSSVYRGLLADFPADRYLLGHEMVDLVDGGSGVEVRFANGASVEADLVVCADGVSSRGRAILEPDVVPAYTGYVAWRGTMPDVDLSAEAFIHHRDSVIYQIVDHGHILTYPIPALDGTLEPGKRLLNFVWYRNYPEGGPFEDLMTDVDGNRRSRSVPPGKVVRRHVDGLHAAARAELAPLMLEAVLGVEEPFVQAIFDLGVSRMAHGRVAIIGDAAFFLRPHVAAGTAKACADGWMLRDCLRDADGDVGAALAAWEPRQLHLGRKAMATTTAMGERSQVTASMDAHDRTWKFGLHGPGDPDE